MVFNRLGPPSVVIDRLRPGERGYLYGDYLSGVYRLSPFYRTSERLKAPLVARIMEIAPQGFAQSEYHRRYFGRIGVADMIGVLLPLDQGRTLFMSFSRSAGRKRFLAADAAALRLLQPVLAAAVSRHEELAGPLGGRGSSPPPRTTPAGASSFGLTGREREVASLILEGHSTRAVAAKLTISIETVRVHRRHIYRKLGVSSQAALFRWFLATRPA